MKKLQGSTPKSNLSDRCHCGTPIVWCQLATTHGRRLIRVSVEEITEGFGDIALSYDLVDQGKRHAIPVANGTRYRLHQPFCEPQPVLGRIARELPRKRRAVR